MLTRKQKAFADHIINNPKDSATEAAVMSYNARTRHTAEVIASENLSKPEIVTYLAEHTELAKNSILEVLINSKILKDEPAHSKIVLEASKDILDRTLGKPIQRLEQHTTSVNLNLDLTQITEANQG